LNAYPSPSTGVFIYKFNRPLKTEYEGNLIVYDILGEKILEKRLPPFNPQLSIDLRNQPNGLYLYRKVNGNDSLSAEGKLEIQK
jgi:Secretion system C-terminal sorting domain